MRRITLRGSTAAAALAVALLTTAGCPGGSGPSTRSLTLTGYALNTAISATIIKNRTYDFYLGNGVTEAQAKVKIEGDMGSTTVKLLDGQGTLLREFTAPTDPVDVAVPGNVVRVVVDKPEGIRPLVSLESFGVTQVTTGAIPEPVAALQSRAVRSFPLTLNEPVFLPLSADEARYTYITVPGIRGKSVDVFVDGAAKVFASDEEHGFILDTATAASIGSGTDGMYTTLSPDGNHDQLLLTIETPRTPDVRTLIVSVNENVDVRDLKVRFLGAASRFGRTEDQLTATLHEILEETSTHLYSVTKGHVRLGSAEVVFGQFSRPGFHQTMSIGVSQVAGFAEAYVDPNSHEIKCGRGWWQMSIDDAAWTLTHEFFHHAFSLPEEYREGFPEVTTEGPNRQATATCRSSIMGSREVRELCVAGTHVSTPGQRQDPHTSMWELLAPRLINTAAPQRSTTELAIRSSGGKKLPVEMR